MKKTKEIVAIALLALVSVCPAMAGGILTNTNQSVSFLRNPARDGAIGIDGVYVNPAGVVWLNDGLHVSVNWQAAFQTRTIDTTNPVFALGANNTSLIQPDGTVKPKTYEGTSRSMFIPSVQAAYNYKRKWSFQVNFSVTGGGGKCEFDEGLGSFEGAVGMIAAGLKPLGVTNYDCDSYMQGKQYYFGFTAGTAYKVTENLSVYGGLRVLYGIANYKAKIYDIMVKTVNRDSYYSFNSFLNEKISDLSAKKEALEKAGATGTAAYATVVGTLAKMETLETYRSGVNLMSNQSGIGVAPILGADFKWKNFNFAVKYEFRTKMSMRNESTVDKVYAIDAVNMFRDDSYVREDQPSLLAFGVQYSPVSCVRINAGYHHFYDKAAKKTYYAKDAAGVSVRYDNKNDMLSHGTNEYLGGIECDITKKLTASAGFQITRYGNTDEFINDLSFVVNSWSFGLGGKYQLTDKVAVQAAFFQTNYDNYKTQMSESGVQNEFNRTNRVIAIGADIDF